VWAYLARFPGLAVVHDPTLHQARAAHLLRERRYDDYRHEFWFDHPDANRDFVEYAIEGLGGPIYYFWPMLRVVMRTSRLVAVHNRRVAADLREEFPETPIEAIRLGKSPLDTSDASRATMRARLGYPDGAIVFAAFGKITAEKRIGAIVGAFSTLIKDGVDARLLLVGDTSDYPSLPGDLTANRIVDRVHITGFVGDEAIAGYLAAADACLCLRWPTAREMSASWLHCLAASRPTIVSDLAHTVDVPERVALRVDLLDEDASLLRVMRRLAEDAPLRAALAAAGHDYWAANHTMDATADDYRRIIQKAVTLPAPETAADLPSHFKRDYTESTRAILRRCGVSVDILERAGKAG
jgi:glycosyltransferase involved in cell wall biosynthesis